MTHTVAELIAILQTQPPDAIVALEGLEYEAAWNGEVFYTAAIPEQPGEIIEYPPVPSRAAVPDYVSNITGKTIKGTPAIPAQPAHARQLPNQPAQPAQLLLRCE